MTYNTIDKYCVRVRCKENQGSGVVLQGKDGYYVYTAAHCLGKIVPEIADIIIEKQEDYQSSFQIIEGLQLVEFDQANDFALIKINFEREDRTSYSYKLARGFFSQNFVTFCGYQGINSTQFRPYDGRILTISDVAAKFKLTLENDTFDQAGEDGHYIAKGLSGSGVFIQRHDSIFLVGILNSVLTDKAWNDDIECCAIHHLEKYIDEYVDLSDFENLKKWEENLEKRRTEREIEAFKKENSDFFEKLYRKNNVLYPETGKADKVTVKQINKFLAMRENIRTLENDYPLLYLKFKNVVKRFVDKVEDDYSQTVDNSSDAKELKRQLEEELKNDCAFLPSFTNFELSQFQVIEWLGMCTLNFTTND